MTLGLADSDTFDFILGVTGSDPLEAGDRGINFNFGSVDPVLIPEPSSTLLLGLGLTFAGVRRRR